MGLDIGQPFFQLEDYLLLGFEQQDLLVVSGVIIDGGKIIVALTARVEGPTYINVHKYKLHF